ncbi:MAG: tRNA pseudouridine(38-40) synthase TruA [Desulfobacterales bacterium]|nr:tRNA pseudouridine(38-40) synthase TruA [Desulfobacterales bacterium]
MSKKNFKLTIEYDGTNYSGWQRQKNDTTIQGEIEKAVFIITKQAITLIGSGRTDAGVHAIGQTANFICETRLNSNDFIRALNCLLPNDIVIKNCEEVSLSFHARFNVKNKTYLYRLINRPYPSAIGRNYCWSITKKINIDLMNKAGAYILGSHDFKSFEGSGSPRLSTIRNVLQSEFIQHDEELIEYRIKANGFLRYMVRNIVGSLVYIGLDRISTDEFKNILESKDRKKAPPTAPPQGLYLFNVEY